MTLLELADACEQAKGADRALNREIALAVGWHRYTPSELERSNPGWIAPEDFAGETVSKDGRKRPVLDSLHGTDIWREPRNFTGSLDAATQLVPDGWVFQVTTWREGGMSACVCEWNTGDFGYDANAQNPSLALTAAALRARHEMENDDEPHNQRPHRTRIQGRSV